MKKKQRQNWKMQFMGGHSEEWMHHILESIRVLFSLLLIFRLTVTFRPAFTAIRHDRRFHQRKVIDYEMNVIKVIGKRQNLSIRQVAYPHSFRTPEPILDLIRSSVSVFSVYFQCVLCPVLMSMIFYIRSLPCNDSVLI